MNHPARARHLLVAATVVACVTGAGFTSPSLAAAGATGTGAGPSTDLLVGDDSASTITKVFADGTANSDVVTSVDSKTTAVDNAGNIYSVVNGDTLVEFPMSGSSPTTLAALPSGNYYGIALDHAKQNVYVSDLGGDILKVPAAGGTPTTVASGHPFVQIGLDKNDNIVAASDDGGVYKIPAGGGAETLLTSVTGEAFGIAVLPDGDFYVGDFGVGISHYSADGATHTDVAGIATEVSSGPLAIALDRPGNLYFTAYSGDVTEVPADGSAPRTVASGFNDPRGLAVLDEPVQNTPVVNPVGSTALPALSLTTSGTPHLRGHKMTIAVTGFAPGERYVVKISRVNVAHGVVDATGSIHRKVRVPFRAHRPKAKLVVKGTVHRVHEKIRILNGIAK